jgi:hypothetical protein
LEEEGESSDVALTAAAAWLLYGAQALRDYSVQNKSFEGKVAKPGSAFSSEEWYGFCEARWGAWKQMLKDRQTPASDQITGDLAKRAVESMENAEK